MVLNNIEPSFSYLHLVRLLNNNYSNSTLSPYWCWVFLLLVSPVQSINEILYYYIYWEQSSFHPKNHFILEGSNAKRSICNGAIWTHQSRINKIYVLAIFQKIVIFMATLGPIREQVNYRAPVKLSNHQLKNHCYPSTTRVLWICYKRRATTNQNLNVLYIRVCSPKQRRCFIEATWDGWLTSLYLAQLKGMTPK